VQNIISGNLKKARDGYFLSFYLTGGLSILFSSAYGIEVSQERYNCKFYNKNRRLYQIIQSLDFYQIAFYIDS